MVPLRLGEDGWSPGTPLPGSVGSHTHSCQYVVRSGSTGGPGGGGWGVGPTPDRVSVPSDGRPSTCPTRSGRHGPPSFGSVTREQGTGARVPVAEPDSRPTDGWESWEAPERCPPPPVWSGELPRHEVTAVRVPHPCSVQSHKKKESERFALTRTPQTQTRLSRPPTLQNVVVVDRERVRIDPRPSPGRVPP